MVSNIILLWFHLDQSTSGRCEQVKRLLSMKIILEKIILCYKNIRALDPRWLMVGFTPSDGGFILNKTWFSTRYLTLPCHPTCPSPCTPPCHPPCPSPCTPPVGCPVPPPFCLKIFQQVSYLVTFTFKSSEI